MTTSFNEIGELSRGADLRRRFRFTLRSMLAGVAVAALVMAASPERLGVPFLILLTAYATTVAGISAWTGASRLKVAALAISFHPILILLSLYATWISAWVALGRIPRASLDDPKSVGHRSDGPLRTYLAPFTFGLRM